MHATVRRPAQTDGARSVFAIEDDRDWTKRQITRLRMVYSQGVCDCRGGLIQPRRRHGRCYDFGQSSIPRCFAIIVLLLFFSLGAAAHPPEAEFADWFRSLKEPGTESGLGNSAPCCSPERDCQTTDYEMDAKGGYWITVEGERIQVPPNKVLQRTDNPTGHGVACLLHIDGHPVVRCFVRAPEG